MKHLSSLALAALLAAPFAAQAAELPEKGQPFAAAVSVGGKWGAVNQYGQQIIPLRYDAAALSLLDEKEQAHDLASMPGRSGLIEVRLDKKYGFYDRAGKCVVPAEFEARSLWQDGALAVQAEKGRIGFYSADGRQIAPPVYEAASDFQDGFAVVKKDGRYGYLRLDGTEIAPVYKEARYFKDGFAPVKDGKWGVINEKGETAVPFLYDDAGPFVSEGLLAVKKDGKWGFVDMTGAEAVPPVYRDVHPVFEGGYTAVETEDKLWGFIDNTGRVTAEPVFKNVLTPFSEGLAGVLTQDGKAYARPDGSIAFHADYERLYAFKDGLAEYLESETYSVSRSSPVSIGFGIGWGWHRRHHRHWGIGWPWMYTGWYSAPSAVTTVKRGYLDTSGRVIASAGLTRVYPATEKGILVFNNGRFGWISRTGLYTIHTGYRTLTPLPEEDCVIARDEDKKWGVLSFSGETLIPFAYTAIESLGGGYFAGKQDGRWALLRKDGAVLTQAVYKEIGPEGSGLFPARTKDSWVYLDTAGKEALRFPEKLQNALSFKDGAAGIKVRGKWGIIDPTGQFTAEPSYDEYRPL